MRAQSHVYWQIDSKTDVNGDSTIQSLTYLAINSRETFITSTLVTVWGCVLADSSIQARVVSTTVIQVYKVKKLHFYQNWSLCSLFWLMEYNTLLCIHVSIRKILLICLNSSCSNTTLSLYIVTYQMNHGIQFWPFRPFWLMLDMD